jgi:hypothetical protein
MSDDEITRRLIEKQAQEFSRQAKAYQPPENPKANRKRRIAEVRQLAAEVLEKLKARDNDEGWEIKIVGQRKKARRIAGYVVATYVGSAGWGSRIETKVWLLENGNYTNGNGDEMTSEHIYDRQIIDYIVSGLKRTLIDLSKPDRGDSA